MINVIDYGAIFEFISLNPLTALALFLAFPAVSISIGGFIILIDKFAFHVGYKGWEAPRKLRRLLARTSLHRCWFAGYSGLGTLSIDELRPSRDESDYFDFDPDEQQIAAMEPAIKAFYSIKD